MSSGYKSILARLRVMTKLKETKVAKAREGYALIHPRWRIVLK
jgi:hypothetical protein